MDSNCLAYIQQISPLYWETTPASVKKLVGEIAVGIGQLEKKVVELEATQQHLLEQINRTSKNSSVPPSSDPPNTPKQQPKRKVVKSEEGNRYIKVIIAPCIPQSSVSVLQTTIQKPAPVVERN